MKLVGESVLRVDAASKADGTTRYTDDLEFDGLYGAIVRSEIAYGNIVSIDFDEAYDFSDFVIADYRDIEGKNVNAMLTDDQPFLAEKSVRFIGEPILLLAHRSKARLKEAAEHIDIKYEVLEPLLTMQESIDRKHLIYGDDNVFKTIRTVKGKEPDYTRLKCLEKTYTTPHQEQLYMETQRMLARYDNGNIKIIGSMQCPFYVESALYALTGKKIEVEQAPTGGAFGGKEDYPSLMAAYAYLLSRKAQKDVKIVYDRAQDIAFSTKRHPSILHYKSYFLARAVLHAAGFYDCEYIKVDAYAYATNTPPNGAFRGFGAPQAIFGIERHMDDIATSLGLSPMEVRRKNLPESRSVSVTGAKIEEYARLGKLFESARKASAFDAKYETGMPYRGIGMALFMHGGGFTGEGEILLASKVWLDLHADGIVEIRVGSCQQRSNGSFSNRHDRRKASDRSG